MQSGGPSGPLMRKPGHKSRQEGGENMKVLVKGNYGKRWNITVAVENVVIIAVLAMFVLASSLLTSYWG